MKRIRNYVCLAMTALFVLLAGCSGNAGNTNNAATQTPADNTEAPGEAEAPASIYPDPNKPVNFTFFGDVTWLAYDNLDGITGREVERLTGVSFDFTKATDSEQLILMMSSNDLPDLVMAANTAKLSRLSNPEYTYSYNELIEKYAPDWEIPEAEQKLNAYYSEDDNFYMLRNEFNTIEELREFDKIGPNFGQLHYRKDIYDAIGAPIVDDKESFLHMLSLVKEQYPDMTPVVFNPREVGGFAQFANYDPGFPKDENGDRCYNFSDPNYKEFFRLFYDMHRLGYITTENITYTTDEQVFQGVTTGKTFLVSHYSGNDDQTFTGNVKTSVPEASFVQMPLTSGWQQTLGVSGWSALFITKNCKDPETAIKLIRWAKEPHNQIITMMGVEGTDWEYADDGTFITLPRYDESFEAGNYESDYKQVGFLLSATDYIRESVKFYTVATPATKEIFSEAVNRINWSTSINLAWPMADTPERTVYSNLDSLDSEYFAKIVTAPDDATFEALYAEMLVEAEKIGLSKFNDTLKDLYNDVSNMLGAK